MPKPGSRDGLSLRAKQEPCEMTNDSISGIIRFSSPWSFNETVRQIEMAFSAKKIKLFDRIDQAAGRSSPAA
jgi:hypothetical protein